MNIPNNGMSSRGSEKPSVLVVIGSASPGSSNSRLMEFFCELTTDEFEVGLFDDLGALPHFDPMRTESLPSAVEDLLSVIESSDAVVICAPEYIFSIPARLKNLLEWCVSTTIFSDKPAGLITASADGKQGHAQMKLIMQTLGARLSEHAELIIPGIKGKFDQSNGLTDPEVASQLSRFSVALKGLFSGEETEPS